MMNESTQTVTSEIARLLFTAQAGLLSLFFFLPVFGRFIRLPSVLILGISPLNHTESSTCRRRFSWSMSPGCESLELSLSLPLRGAKITLSHVSPWYKPPPGSIRGNLIGFFSLYVFCLLLFPRDMKLPVFFHTRNLTSCFLRCPSMVQSFVSSNHEKLTPS